ncbi:MAG TPA: fatty acid desaturase [Solirubrobacterales bacterium]
MTSRTTASASASPRRSGTPCSRRCRACGAAESPRPQGELELATNVGVLVSGTLAGAATGLLWGGLVRVFFVHHVTWSVNFVCHFFGTRGFDTDDKSTNVFWLAVPSLGESWHHNHHAFPRSATHGLRRGEIDPSAAIIVALEKVGLARNVIRITPERQAQRAI